VQEGELVTRLSSAIRDALLRGNLDVATPDGGDARFGNVNGGGGGGGLGQSGPTVAREAEVATRIRRGLRAGHLDVATPDGGYARFGNVNVGRGTEPGG